MLEATGKMRPANPRPPASMASRRLEEGRGQGRGYAYKPWLNVRDVHSLGLSTRVRGWKTGRLHSLLSQLETRYFYVLEGSTVIDIREQYPLLPLEETIAIANECSLVHPRDPATREPVTMTTDFIITARGSAGLVECARAVKQSQDLASKRTLEKLELERRYWTKRGVDWKIVTENDIPAGIADNIQWLHPYFEISDHPSLTEDNLRRIERVLGPKIREGGRPLARCAAESDDELGLPPGTSLTAVRHLLAVGRWVTDLTKLIDPAEPLVLVNQPSAEGALHGILCQRAA